MKLIVIVILCIFITSAARADEAAQCEANAGTYLTGRVTGAPTFVSGHPRKGVELSHTHLTLLSDQDGRPYDVAIDNGTNMGTVPFCGSEPGGSGDGAGSRG